MTETTRLAAQVADTGRAQFCGMRRTPDLPEPDSTAMHIFKIKQLRAAIWRAMMEIENDGADAAFETLQQALEPIRD